MNNEQLPGLYIHVPFCGSRCLYCDFYSETDTAFIPAWLQALEQEARIYKNQCSAFDTLYIGGGTPTVLENAALGSVFECLNRHFNVSADAELTVEANPQDLTPEKLRILKACGVNRISVGVQSFNAQDLHFLQRRHSVAEAVRALELIRSCGFTTLGIDLMYGLPEQTVEGWLATLAHAVTFQPEHISCYQLTVADGTRLAELFREGTVALPDEHQGALFFVATAQFLEQHGYVHYEISNFALGESNRSRHNQKYWHHVPYLGLGPAAHSFQCGCRWWNHKSIQRYCQELAAGRLPISGAELLSEEQLHLEALSLGLRTAAGVDLLPLYQNQHVASLLPKLLESQYAQIIQGRLIPTRKGFLVADRLARALM
jgi:oxygen-independent coproporphyrinogen-3 oxidase